MYKSILLFLLCSLTLVSIFSFSDTYTDLSKGIKPCDEFISDDYVHYAYDGVNIDNIIDYVKSLDLDEKGYAYVEETCLAELRNYKRQNIVIGKYTVLIPKSKEKEKIFYGNLAKKDFYCQYISEVSFRRETIISEEDSKNDSKKGIFYDPYENYVEQFHDLVTRIIYKENIDGTYSIGYMDQEGSLRISKYLCTIDAESQTDYMKIGEVYKNQLNSNELDKSEILSLANAYSNRKEIVNYRLSYFKFNKIE